MSKARLRFGYLDGFVGPPSAVSASKITISRVVASDPLSQGQNATSVTTSVLIITNNQSLADAEAFHSLVTSIDMTKGDSLKSRW